MDSFLAFNFSLYYIKDLKSFVTKDMVIIDGTCNTEQYDII